MLARIAGVGLLLLLLPGSVGKPSSSAVLVAYSGEATGWNNAQKIVVDQGGMIHIVYQQELTPDHKGDLFAYARSLDGESWEIAVYEGRWPTIAIGTDSARIYTAFVRRQAEQDMLQLVEFTGDEGAELVVVSSDPHSLFFPAIAVESSLIHLAWEAHRGRRSYIQYAQLDRSSQELRVEVVAEGTRGLYFPSLAVGPDGVHLTWEEEADAARHRIVHGWRGPSGWQVEELPQEGPPPLNGRYPALDYDPARREYELVFVDYASGGNGIYYQALSADGWSEPECLSCGLEPGYWTFPTVEDGVVFFGRQVSAGCPIGPLYYSYLIGDSWREPQVLEGAFSAFPHLFRHGKALHLIWTDRDPQSPVLRLIRYRQIEIAEG